MKEKESKHRILILGVSGFIGNAIYKELCSYFKTFGTYATPNPILRKNHQFIQYNHEEDDIIEILKIVKPSIIISALRGDFGTQIIAHQHISEYLQNHNCKIIYLSSSNVFDGYTKFPSYEQDKTLSNSVYGHFKIKVENMLMRLPKHKWAILRLPMVFGLQSPRIEDIKMSISENSAIEIFPNLIMNVTTDTKATQQIHYIINRNKTGVFHLGSVDLVHHDDYIKDIVKSLGFTNPLFKRVYTTNDERYLAILPKDNKLPKHLQLVSQDILTELKV